MMIIAEVGDFKFKLPNLKDAEELLRIFHDAVLVDTDYNLPYYGDRYFEKPGRTVIEISVSNTKLLSYEEAQKLIAEKQKKEAEGKSLKSTVKEGA